MASVSVIIPTLSDADPSVLQVLQSQTLPPCEIEVVRGIRPNGRARNVGVSRTNGEILVFLDDDARPFQPRLIEKLTAPLLSEPEIGATGASRLIPPDSSAFQRWSANQVARIENQVVQSPVISRPAPENHFYCAITTTCCALRRTLFDEMGGFDEKLIQGVDTEFFVRMGRAGYAAMLVPDLWVYHAAPPGLRALLQKHFRYGLGHAQAVLRDPLRARPFEKRPLLYLLLRSAALVPHAFLGFSYAESGWHPGFKPLKALVSYAAALGYVWGRFRTKTAQ
jgi:cellulose synthase/poly-beta-1,6-N-acetylglucosamine synthase-like glycosyltransferase